MFEAGKIIELKSEYGSILFTLWAPSVIVRSFSRIAEMAIYQGDVLEGVFGLGYVLIDSTLEVFGLFFAVLCFSYIHSRYMFVDKINQINEEKRAKETE